MSRLLGQTHVNPNKVLAELFKLYTFEELVVIANSESDDAPIAYRVLAEKQFDKFEDKLKEDLKSNFAELRERTKSAEGSSSGLMAFDYMAVLRGGWKPEISDFTTAALSGIAINGDRSCRDIVLPFLETKQESVQIAALVSLRRVGQAQDADVALKIAEEGAKSVEVEAAKTALALRPGETGSAGPLLRSRKPELVRLALASLLSSEKKEVWPQIADRLYDDNDDIRKLVCAYAVKTFPVRRLAKLLDDYLRKDRYFYNVVFYLDRAIYAKRPLRKLFVGEIEEALVRAVDE